MPHVSVHYRVYLGAAHHRRPRNPQPWVEGDPSSEVDVTTGGSITPFAPPSLVYTPPQGPPVNAGFLFWSVNDGGNGGTQTSRALTTTVGSNPITLIAWYYLPPSGGPNGTGGPAILIDAYSVQAGDFIDDDFVDVTSDPSLTTSANVDGVVPTQSAETLNAYDSVPTGESFRQWAVTTDAGGANLDVLDAPAGATGLTVATYSKVPAVVPHVHVPQSGVVILFGVTQDGGGVVVPIGGGPPIPIGPWGPFVERIVAAAAVEAAGKSLSKRAAAETEKVAHARRSRTSQPSSEKRPNADAGRRRRDGRRRVTTAPLRSDRVLHTPIAIGGATIRNRLYRAPVLEGAGDGDDAADLLARQFVENARHGVGLIIQGSSCIFTEGRTSPGMTCVDTRAKTLRLAPMVDAVHARRRGDLHPARSRRPLRDGGVARAVRVAADGAAPRGVARPPWLRPAFRGVPIHVMTTDEVRAMAVAVRRGRGVDARGRLRRRATRIRQREVARPVPVAVLQPPHRRVRRFAREPRPRAALIRAAVAERAGADYPVHRQGARPRPRRCGSRVRPTTTRSPLRAGRGMGLRRGHAGRGVGVPRHHARPRRHAGLVRAKRPWPRGCDRGAGPAPAHDHRGRRPVGARRARFAAGVEPRLCSRR